MHNDGCGSGAASPRRAGHEQNITRIDGGLEKLKLALTHKAALGNNLYLFAFLRQGQEDNPAVVANKPHPARHGKLPAWKRMAAQPIVHLHRRILACDSQRVRFHTGITKHLQVTNTVLGLIAEAVFGGLRLARMHTLNLVHSRDLLFGQAVHFMALFTCRKIGQETLGNPSRYRNVQKGQRRFRNHIARHPLRGELEVEAVQSLQLKEPV